MSKLDILAEEIGSISDNTLGKYLRTLVGLGLLVVSNPDNKKWRYARYSLPVEVADLPSGLMPVGQKPSTRKADSIIEQPINWRLADEKVEEEPHPEQQETMDDFKPLATLELDGWELVDEKGDKWVRGRELSVHLGYALDQSVIDIYNEHKTFFKDGIDTTIAKLTTVDGKERETRVFSFTGGLKICRYSEMPKADEVMQQLIDLADKVRRGEYPARVSQISEHIAMWQKALLGDVLQPKFAQIEGNITEVKQTVEEVKAEVSEVKQTVAGITDADKNRIMQSDIDQYEMVSEVN